MSASDWAHVHPDMTLFSRPLPAYQRDRLSRRALLASLLGSSACWFGVAGLVAMAECNSGSSDVRPGPHMNGGRGAGRPGIQGRERGNGENPQRGG